MNEKTIAEITQYLDTLIERAGGTIETIWPYLIKQAYIEFAISLFCFIVFTTGTILCLALFTKIDGSSYADEALKITAMVAALLLAIFAICALIGVMLTSAGALNPEYYAIKELLSVIK
jgi:hypothetical protein